AVGWLRGVAEITGTTYEEVNVYLFMILLPMVLVLFLIIMLKQRNKISRLKEEVSNGSLLND
ncbi:MAG: hypothetical protein CL388_06710, partial [Acidiferrobacteraceae bacterium]|nr:hypothetical protein [Acidiferrobacteraceae bacterium]